MTSPCRRDVRFAIATCGTSRRASTFWPPKQDMLFPPTHHLGPQHVHPTSISAAGPFLRHIFPFSQQHSN